MQDQETLDHDNEIVEDTTDKQELFEKEDQSLNNNIPDVPNNDLDLSNENENTNQTSPSLAAPPLFSDEERKKQLLR